MKPAGTEAEVLRALASMPFLDRTEMVAVTGRSKGAVYEAVDRLEEAGLCTPIPHAAVLLPQTQRYHLTAAGLQRLAGEEGISPDGLLAERPLSAQWRRSLMERLDALASIYRLAAGIAAVEYPVRFRWFRSLPLDAAVALPGGRSVGIVRRGNTADRSPFSNRMWRLRGVPLPSAVLVLMPDHVRLRHSRRMLDGFPAPVFLAVEAEAIAAAPDEPVWSPAPVSAAIDLRSLLASLEEGGEVATEPALQGVSLPDDLAVEGPGWDIPDYMLPAKLKAAEKRAVELVSDWPWLTLTDLAGLMGVTHQRASQVVIPLEMFKLVVRHPGAGGRLAVTDRGLGFLARRDRASLGIARGRWSGAPLIPGAPFDWTAVTGRRSRQLLRNIEHTAAVHAFIAHLAVQAGLVGWEVSQLDPPQRASRHFSHDGGRRSVNPDAFGVLTKGDSTWPFFLEWERRAVRPTTMSERLAPYLRYYSSHRPTDDHGTRPDVLVVFDDDVAHTHFLRVARNEMEARAVHVPLWVSHRRAIEELGPLGRAWRTPGDPTSPQALPPQ